MYVRSADEGESQNRDLVRLTGDKEGQNANESVCESVTKTTENSSFPSLNFISFIFLWIYEFKFLRLEIARNNSNSKESSMHL